MTSKVLCSLAQSSYHLLAYKKISIYALLTSCEPYNTKRSSLSDEAVPENQLINIPVSIYEPLTSVICPHTNIDKFFVNKCAKSTKAGLALGIPDKTSI